MSLADAMKPFEPTWSGRQLTLTLHGPTTGHSLRRMLPVLGLLTVAAFFVGPPLLGLASLPLGVLAAMFLARSGEELLLKKGTLVFRGRRLSRNHIDAIEEHGSVHRSARVVLRTVRGRFVIPVNGGQGQARALVCALRAWHAGPGESWGTDRWLECRPGPGQHVTDPLASFDPEPLPEGLQLTFRRESRDITVKGIAIYGVSAIFVVLMHLYEEDLTLQEFGLEGAVGMLVVFLFLLLHSLLLQPDQKVLLAAHGLRVAPRWRKSSPTRRIPYRSVLSIDVESEWHGSEELGKERPTLTIETSLPDLPRFQLVHLDMHALHTFAGKLRELREESLRGEALTGLDDLQQLTRASRTEKR